jgi:hypothetical protein
MTPLSEPRLQQWCSPLECEVDTKEGKLSRDTFYSLNFISDVEHDCSIKFIFTFYFFNILNKQYYVILK